MKNLQSFFTVKALRRLFPALLFVFLCRGGANAQKATVATDASIATDALTQKAIDAYVESLDARSLIAQLFAIGIEGTKEMPQYAKNEFASAPPGSFLLFKANIGSSPCDVIDFTHSIHKWYTEANNFAPPLMLIDNEGGDVYRLRGIASLLPSAADTVRLFSVKEAESYYELIGTQMKALGLQVNLSPLVESLTEQNRSFLQNRSYGKAVIAAAYSAAAIRGYEKAHIASVIKHFPGNTGVDPHKALSVLDVTRKEFDTEYKPVFEKLIRSQNVPALLMSHVCVPCIEEGVPACLSRAMIEGVVRGELGFTGVIISDDVFMGALDKSGFSGGAAAVKAMYAGVDMLMLSEKHYGDIFDALVSEYTESSAFRDVVTKAVTRILRLKTELGLMAVKTVGEETTLTAVPFASKEERLTAFENAKQKADAFYTEVMAKQH